MFFTFARPQQGPLSTPPLLPSFPFSQSTCSSCTSYSYSYYSYYWCQSSQSCYSSYSYSSCPSSCLATSSNDCSAVASTCSSTSSTSDTKPETSVAAGTAVSVILGALLAPLTLLLPYAGAPEAAMEAWKPRARKAWPLLAAANGFLSMGVLTGLAAPLIPWSSENGDFTGVTMPGSLYYSYYSYYSSYGAPPQRVPNVYLLGGSVSIFLGLLFCLIGWGLGLCAAARVRGVAVYGASTGEGCCAPSMPAIQGLVWTGFVYCLSGAIANWTLTSILLSLSSYSSYYITGSTSGSKSSPGGGLLAFSIACLFISAILYSVTGCCALGPLPGVGTASSNCCCVERNRSQPPPPGGCCASAAPPAQQELQLRGVYAPKEPGAVVQV